jgi:hypothetical protein
VVLPDWVEVRVIHRFPQPDPSRTLRWFVDRSGGICGLSQTTHRTEGRLSAKYYFRKGSLAISPIRTTKINDILLYRSKDKGVSWTGPMLSTNIPYKG